MTTATGLPPNVEVYLEALRAELLDLAAEEREDLLSEVEPSLLEAAADGDDPIAARLGPAADFAADLRASAGLPPAPRAPVQRPGFRAALAQLADSPQARRARGLARELAPLWWAARACLAVGALAVVFEIEWSVQWPMLPRYGSVAGTIVVVVAALAISCALGLATRRGSLRRTSLLISAAALVATPFVVDAAGAPARVRPRGSRTPTGARCSRPAARASSTPIPCGTSSRARTGSPTPRRAPEAPRRLTTKPLNPER